MSDDPADPRTWMAQLLRALAGLQRGDKGPAGEYLRFVEQHRGRAVAEAARRRLPVLARAPEFSEAWRKLDDVLHGRPMGKYGARRRS